MPGAGGTVGLARFLAEASGSELLVTGSTMVDASLLARSPSPDRATPIARLAVDPFGLAVPAGSAIRSVADLQDAMRGESGTATFAGGPTGSIDHVGAFLLVRAMGLPATRLNYVAHLTGADAAAAAADEKATALFMSLGDLDAEIRAGHLRLLAVGAAAPVPGLEAGTLAQAGIPLELSNWRGLVARPGLATAEQTRLSHMIGAIEHTKAWQQLLERKRWLPAYLPASGFGPYLQAEQARLKEALKAMSLLKRAGE